MQPKLDAKLFILRPGGTGKDHGGILLARITTKTYPAPIDQENLIEEVIGTPNRGMIIRIQLIYYSWIVYSWRRSTVTDGGCKDSTSNAVRIQWKRMWKMATRNEWDELQYHNKENWNDAYNNKQDRKHNNLNTNDDVDTSHFDDRVAHYNMHWAEPARIVSQSLIITLTFMAQAESCTFHTISMPSMCALVVSLWLDLLHSLLLSLPPVCPLLPPQRRAAAEALQEEHGKPVRLR